MMSEDMIDFQKTSSNDINEIYHCLGSGSLRTKLIEEITDLIEYDGSYINSRHIELLADTMTFSGVLISINRQESIEEILVLWPNVHLKIQPIN